MAFSPRYVGIDRWRSDDTDGKARHAMTYCLALRLNEGLVFMADTRTNAGVDDVGIYRKLHVLTPAPDRVFVIESAGSLAATQEVLDRIERDLASSDGRLTLASVDYLFEAALYLGRLSREVAREHRDALKEVGVDGTATFILGGHVGDGPPDILLVYPEGNYIRRVRRAALSPDRRDEVRKVPLGAGRCIKRRPPDGSQDRARIHDEHDSGKSLGRPPLRRRHLSERNA